MGRIRFSNGYRIVSFLETLLTKGTTFSGRSRFFLSKRSCHLKPPNKCKGTFTETTPETKEKFLSKFKYFKVSTQNSVKRGEGTGCSFPLSL